LGQKKGRKSKIKNQTFLSKRYCATFLFGRYNIIKKKKFAPENVKKTPSKITEKVKNPYSFFNVSYS
jgi:hypothetical protein